MNSELAETHSGGFVVEHALVGQHPTMVTLRALIERVAPADVTVLITGESGTGKEVVARAIHALSTRNSRPFVPVNCAAIPQDLLESEMFGHERGAFTGASGPRHGLFSSADGGTILLDEIGEMPLPLQTKLLRVLEDGVVRPVGSDRASRVDTRVIAASNTDLAEAVRKGFFRQDLYYRLQVVPIMTTPLRERRSDIALLAEYFLTRLSVRQRGRTLSLSREALVSLWSYEWPGNVRELENMIARLAIMCESTEIDVSLLPSYVTAQRRSSLAQFPETLGPEGIDFNKVVRELEGKLINEALKVAGGSKQAAAKLLGLKRTTFSAKLRRYGVIAYGRNGAEGD